METVDEVLEVLIEEIVEGIIEDGIVEETKGTEGTVKEGTEGIVEETKWSEESGLSSFINFRYCPCCFLECAIMSAVLF